MSTFGFEALNNLLNNNKLENNLTDLLLGSQYIPVRVVSIVLNESHPRFLELGGWNGLGTIEYSSVVNPSTVGPFPIAIPLSANSKKYPLVNEIVYLLSLPNKQIGEITSNSTLYYVDIVSIWNHPHHNAFPLNPNKLPNTQQRDYVETQVGAVRRITDQSTEIFLGNTFVERANIHPLLPFEGDTIHEGRWGNSIRLGSTVIDTDNNWSKDGTNGDPILIVRNGQGQQTEEGWIPITEDINNDDSSIYLTSNQQIPLNASSTSYLSYLNSPPETPNQFKGKQILLNSGRLMFNTVEDHLLLSSAKSINLNAKSGVNIDSPTFTIQSKNTYIGSKNATEPLLLGNRTVDTLNNILENLNSFLQICSTLVSSPPGTPLITLNVAATQASQQLVKIQSTLEKLKSKSNYTI